MNGRNGTGHGWFSRMGSPAGQGQWPLFWPGIVLILFGILILLEPFVLVALIAGAFIGLGAFLLIGGWRARRAWTQFESFFVRWF